MNSINYKAFMVQFLVQNYIVKTYDNEDVHIYSELVNDIDVFRKNIDTVIFNDKLRKRFGVDTAQSSLQVFINNLSEDYVESYEVKTSKDEYIYKFHNVLKLIDDVKYPNNVKLILAVVPTGFGLDVEPYTCEVELFERFKHIILNDITKHQQMRVFNAFIHDNTLKSMRITTALEVILDKLKHDKIPDYEALSDEHFETLLNNFSLISIRVLTFEELTQIPISNDVVKNVLCM